MTNKNLRKSKALYAASLRQLLLVVALACFGTAWAQTPVAQVSNDGTNWTQFEQLITGNSETGAFDYANTLSGNVVIELLKATDDSYTLTSSFTFNNNMTSLTLRTAASVGQRATLTKDQTSGSMIVMSSSTSLTVQDVVFDGNNKDSNSSGGAIRQDQSNSVTIIDCDFVNCKATGYGGAVYSNGNVTVQCTQDHSISFEGCVGTIYGGAICGEQSFTMENYGTVTFQNCNVPRDGGAIRMRYGITINNYSSLSFTNCDGQCGGAMENENNVGITINNTGTLTIEGCDASSPYYGGGGIAVFGGTLSITNSGTMSINNCTSAYGGGGIYANNAMTIASTAANQVTISNCTAPTGGGLYANSTASLTGCTITGCLATSKGSGVYTASSSLTLGNTVSITDNTLGNTTVTNGAGIYMSGVIYIADDGEGANITVYDNYTSNNQRSDTKTGNTVPPFQITASSLTGQIGVVDAGANSLHVAHSTVPQVCGDPIQYVFADDAGTYNCIEYVGQDIYWGIISVTPVCKITDAGGYLLYRGSNGSDDPEAVFPLLEYAFAASQEAFTHADGTPATPAHIEMIVSDYTQNTPLNLPDVALTLKTASTTPPDNNYPGPESNAVITRGGSFTTSMFVMDNNENLTLENITIDGNNVEATTNGGIIRMESSNCHFALNEGTMLKQGLSSYYGGAVYVASNAVFSMSGATIEHCSARAGGAVYIDGTSGTANTIENSTFSYCNATGTYNYYQNYEHGGGAVRSLKPITVSTASNKQTLFDHCTTTTIGGAIYASTVTLTNDGTVSFVDCNAPGDGGALRTLNGITINNYSQLSFTNCDSQCGGAMENNNSGSITINNMGTLTIEGCDANSSIYGGGGIAAYNSSSLSITNSGTMSITNCTSAYGGGGLFVNNGALTIMGGSTAANQVAISNCSAPQGGGIYTDGTSLTLGSTISITGNTIDNTTIGNGAGIYMANANGVITIADDGAGANITVYGNTTSDDQPSDIKTGKTVQPFEITASALTGQIGVANTTVSERSLGQSTVSQVLGAPIQNVFVDNCGNYDYIEYKGDNQELIYWYSNVYHFTTDGLWSEAANWQDGIVPYNNVDEIYIDAACQLDQNANVGTLTVTDGQSLTLQSGNTLTVNAVLTNTNAEALVIKDGAQLINASPNVAATVEKDITGYGTNNPDGWYTIASPVNSMAIEASYFLTPEYDLYRFNETNLTHEEWENYKGNLHEDFTAFENGRGYLYANSNTFTPTFVGTLNNAAVTCQLTRTSRPDELDGFNLIGNPFLHNIYKGNGCAIYHDKLASGYYTLTNEGAWHVHPDDEAILPGQGILVNLTPYTYYNSYTTTLTINKMATSGNSKAVEPRMDISVTGAQGSDRCFAYFCEGIGLNKINNLNENAPSVSIRNEGQDYAIAHLNRQSETLDVMFNNKKAGNYTIAIGGNGISFEYLHLIDNITGADVDLLRQPNYTFHATGNEFAARFKVVFKPMTGVGEHQQESFCFVSGETLYVNMETEGGLLTLTDVLGRTVKSVNMSGNTCSISGLQSGIYVVRLTEGTKSHVQKIVINH